MNFTPNPNALLQQQHQVPVTTSAQPTAGAQQGGSMPNSNQPDKPSFPNIPSSEMIAKMIAIRKNQLPPSAVMHQGQPPAQNNNNHGVGVVSQQTITQIQNFNRNPNMATFQQSQHMSAAPKTMGIFHQMQQASHQYQSHFPQAPPVSQSLQAPLQPAGMSQQGQQNFLQKLQAVIPQAINQINKSPIPQPTQQQMKPVTIQPPPVSQHSMQYSPPKPVHPQMKTTAKLASPGSQLQKSPTAPNPPHPVGQPSASQNKIVPSTPPIASPVTTAAPAAAGLKVPTTVTPVKQPVVPSLSPSPSKQAPAVEPTPTKAVEQPKEAAQVVPTQNKIVPKASVEKAPTLEANNKVDAGAVPGGGKSAASPSKSTMRLATVTPARQKKPPATNNKKPPVTPPVQAVPKTPPKVVPAAVKVVEAPMSVKKPAVAAKINPAPSTSGNTTPKTKRARVKVQPYQSPTPELALVTKLSTQIANSNNKNGNDDKLTIFYK